MKTDPQTILVLRGTGEFPKLPVVAEGFITSDGRAVLAWLGRHRSVAVYPTVRDLYEVHRVGHGDTWIVNASRDAEIMDDPMHPNAIVGAVERGGRLAANLSRTTEPRRLRWVALDWIGNMVGLGEYLEPRGAASSDA